MAKRCLQTGAGSGFDSRLDSVIALSAQLLQERGIFHTRLYFTSGQVTLWPLRDPCNYQVWFREEFLSPGFASRFRQTSYPINAIVPPDVVPAVLLLFKALRKTDSERYLHSGSLNIINGTVGLHFAGNGKHYLDYRDFLRHRRSIHR